MLLTKNKRLGDGPGTPVAESVWPRGLPSCKGTGIFLRLHQTCYGSSREDWNLDDDAEGHWKLGLEGGDP